MRKTELTKNIEQAIWDIADQFAGNKAFYFRNESDIQSRLFASLAANIGDIELIHAEQRIEYSRSWHDLVIWKPEQKAEALSKWDRVKREFAEELPDLVHSVIEIKHFYGGPDKAREYTSYGAICNQQDIDNLIYREKCGCTYAYFVMFWDDDVQSDVECFKYFTRLKRAFTTFRKHHPKISILCKTRDGMQIRKGI